MTVLSLDQVDALAANITPRYRGWVYVAAVGGLRWPETVGLRRRHVSMMFSDGPAGSRNQSHPTDPAPGWGDEHPRPEFSTMLRVVEQLLKQDGRWVRSETKGRNRDGSSTTSRYLT